jgi:hypothetical protein
VGRGKLSRDQNQAPPLNVEDVATLTAGTSADDARAVRDFAFAVVASDLLAGPSEIATLRWEKIEFAQMPEGGANYRLLRSKADQLGKGAPNCT